MSINWVMLDEAKGFVYLPNERLLYTSPPRTSLALQPLPSYTGSEKLSLQSSDGKLYLTNQRVVYIPNQRTPGLESFSAPLLNLHDSHISVPFFGPNAWNAVVQPVPGGGIPSSLPAVHAKITFKEGGASDFHTKFERMKERFQQALEVSGESTGRGAGGVDMANVHLEDLPAYSGPQSSLMPATADNNPTTTRRSPSVSSAQPQEPPPDYEEVQRQSVTNELEEMLRRAS
ncbi:hypothetical protein BJX68DRAFT_245397 [Aspergillus pseudodeflectus]|uniref:WW-domain-binding protein n=1 Tax=Aspergillus pseudodeflectus TaxID=176178 RepID=A0ABR4JNP7_9EURO